VVAADGLKATAENLERLIARRTAVAANGGGEAASALRLHVFRRDELIELQAHPQPAVADTCELLLLDPVPEPVAQARAAWLANAG
jgi:hypothetical protein